MTRRDRKNDNPTHRNIPASQTGSTEPAEADLQDIASAEGVSQPDMNRDPLAGAMGQDSLQDDTIADAGEEDTGLPARNDASPPGGPGSRNTSAPAGSEIGADAPPGAVAGDGTATCPTDFPIKASQESMRFHVPGRTSYNEVTPTWCFADEAAALNAGYQPDE